MLSKAVELLAKIPELEQQLSDPAIFSDQKLVKSVSQEHSWLMQVKNIVDRIDVIDQSLAQSREALKTETDHDMAGLYREEMEGLEKERKDLHETLERLLVPPDPTDNLNTIVEVRAGTGGDEAGIFVGDLVRMYQMYATKMKWKCEILSASESEHGGYKEAFMVMSGPAVYRYMKFEGGTHRVQRVPATEAQGRVHTSAATVAVLAEPEDDGTTAIDEKDLRIDTYRSSGAGGQHVNTTDSAVRITHVPTGVVVYCQEERSQHKNKEKAMRLLKAKIAEEERRKQEQAMAAARNAQVGSGDRSERIRTYNFPQNRLTDHRVDLTVYNLDGVMDGALKPISEALIAHHHQRQLEAL